MERRDLDKLTLSSTIQTIRDKACILLYRPFRQETETSNVKSDSKSKLISLANFVRAT